MTQATCSPVLGYILKGYPRISETFISNEILLLEKLGFAMRLFPMRKPRESFCHSSVKKIKARVDYLPTELLADFPRLLVPTLFVAVKHPKTFLQTLRFATEGLAKGKELATLKHLLQAGYLAGNHLLPDNNIVHLHGHFAHSPTSVTLFASQLTGIPFSFTAHAKDIYTSDKTKIARKIKQAEFVFTCTQHNKEYLEALVPNGSTPIHCIYHGIDLKLFTQPTPPAPTHTPYKLLTIARMTEKKGLPFLYKALSLLNKKGICFQHTLIGDGDDKEKIAQLISDLGLKEQCRCLGTRTHEEVLKQFKKSDLFVLACVIAQNGDRDGIPNVLVESLAMGVPALSTTVSAIPEILIDNQTGLTVPPSSPEALADGIMRLLSDNVLRQRLIDGGRKYVHDNFNNSQLIEKMATIFRSNNVLLQTQKQNVRTTSLS